MKIAVTGGSGKIGSRTVALLRERGHDVLSLDIRQPTDKSLPFAVLDLRAPSAVRRAFDGQDVVLHLGEMPNVGTTEPFDCFAHNTQVGSAVMEIAVQCQVKRIVYTSSCQTYGLWGNLGEPAMRPDYLPIDETHPLRPQNAYALSKVCNEMYAQQLVQKHGVPIAAFRFPAVFAHETVHWMTQRAKMRSMSSWGEHDMGTYVHVDDAALAYALAAERGWTGFEAYHFLAADIMSGVTTRELIAKQFPTLAIPESFADATDPYAAPTTTAKALAHFGWRASWSLRAALELARQSATAQA